MKKDVAVVRCANEGCGREAVEGERFCEACGLEWALFRRDTRPEADARAGKPEDSAAGALAWSAAGSVLLR